MGSARTVVTVLVALAWMGGCSSRETTDEAPPHPGQAEPAPAAEPAGPSHGEKEREEAPEERAAQGADRGHAHAHGDLEPAALPPGFEGPGQLELPAELRALVVAEMVQVESAMHRTLSALVRGDLAAVESTARAIHDSFILTQKLTPEQAATLRDRLPPEFVSLDRQFHREAEALAEAAAAGDAGRSAEAYARMTTRCVGCHRAYARERFPGLAQEGGGVRGHGHGHGHGHAPHRAAPHAPTGGSEEPP